MFFSVLPQFPLYTRMIMARIGYSLELPCGCHQETEHETMYTFLEHSFQHQGKDPANISDEEFVKTFYPWFAREYGGCKDEEVTEERVRVWLHLFEKGKEKYKQVVFHDRLQCYQQRRKDHPTNISLCMTCLDCNIDLYYSSHETKYLARQKKWIRDFHDLSDEEEISDGGWQLSPPFVTTRYGVEWDEELGGKKRRLVRN
jgi:hypothetical protein